MPKLDSLIYTELLSNIRQISVIVELDEPCDATTRVELGDHGNSFRLTRGKKAVSLQFPSRVSPNTRLQKPTPGSKELSWRLPLADPRARPASDSGGNNEAPWSARSFAADTEILCRSCDSAIVQRGTIKIWKDLPSENWAEMMDFWHCHKPDVPEHQHDHDSKHKGTNSHKTYEGDHESVAIAKGYGINTKFMAIPGTAFVDTTTFLFASADCSISESNMGIKKVVMHCCCNCCVATDTNAQDKALDAILHVSQSIRTGIPSSSVDGLPVGCRYRTRKLPAMPPKYWDAMGLLRDTFENHASLISYLLGYILHALAFTFLATVPQARKSAGFPVTETTPSQEAASISRGTYCKFCSKLVGYNDQQSEGIRIWKWNLKIGSSASSEEQPSISSIVSTQLSNILQAQGGSRLLLVPRGWKPPITTAAAATTDSSSVPDMHYPLISLWILTPSLRYSVFKESHEDIMESSTSVLAMKVFWKAVTENEATRLINTAEEVSLPLEAIKEILLCLRDSARFLPSSARKFQGWDVGLLRRWDGELGK